MEGRNKNPKSHRRDQKAPAQSKKKEELPVIEEGSLQFDVADSISGRPMGRGFEVHQDFNGVLVGYDMHEPDAVKQLCQPDSGAERAFAVGRWLRGAKLEREGVHYEYSLEKLAA
jgi:hypothetical protein